ncbi:hypothetical protein EYF80_001116 [Liparis tanakae]|uniref:Uncharacterized protein n=1 Tax=Liparis tanakae TaxID=230148 RepID=A0A4Z2JG63_9TELE|nr:hypothetical protein EYF80_001116 [Liparis tanakae]
MSSSLPMLTELILHSKTRNCVGGGYPGDDKAAGALANKVRESGVRPTGTVLSKLRDSGGVVDRRLDVSDHTRASAWNETSDQGQGAETLERVALDVGLGPGISNTFTALPIQSATSTLAMVLLPDITAQRKTTGYRKTWSLWMRSVRHEDRLLIQPLIHVERQALGGNSSCSQQPGKFSEKTESRSELLALLFPKFNPLEQDQSICCHLLVGAARRRRRQAADHDAVRMLLKRPSGLVQSNKVLSTVQQHQAVLKEGETKTDEALVLIPAEAPLFVHAQQGLHLALVTCRETEGRSHTPVSAWSLMLMKACNCLSDRLLLEEPGAPLASAHSFLVGCGPKRLSSSEPLPLDSLDTTVCLEAVLVRMLERRK